MKKFRKVLFLWLLLLCIKYKPAFSFDEDALIPDISAPEAAGGTFRHGLIALGQTILSNTVVMSFNISVYQLTGEFQWATPNRDSIRHNLSGPRNWKWEDTDGFAVNHFGHPYQGATYFSAGRANGFGFYQSVFFSAFGSLTWEVFHENNISSLNDMFTTIPSSMSMGEMLFRLYIQAVNAGVPAPLAFFINPMAGFNRLVTNWEPPAHDSNIYQFRTYLGAGYAFTRSSVSGGFVPGGELYAMQRPFVDAGFSVIYGNPFLTESIVPFQHFQLALSIGLDMGNHMDFRIISDGYLFSFAPIFSNTHRMSTGLSLHLDAASLGRFNWYRGSTINKYSNALNWTVKYQRLFPQGSNFQIKFHAGGTFFGSSVFYCPDLRGDLNNFGGGINGKLFFNLNHHRFGTLEISLLGYTLWTYPGTSAIERGRVWWLFNDITYLYPITGRVSLGLTHSLALERGNFSNFPSTRKTIQTARVFLAWNF